MPGYGGRRSVTQELHIPVVCAVKQLRHDIRRGTSQGKSRPLHVAYRKSLASAAKLPLQLFKTGSSQGPHSRLVPAKHTVVTKVCTSHGAHLQPLCALYVSLDTQCRKNV